MENKFNLPEPLVKALTPERRRPVPGRIGVTALIDSPLRRILTMRHFDEITEDYSENIWVLLGKMGHRALELDKTVSELRFEKDMFGAKIVGVTDYSSDGTVIDFKFTSVWAAVFASEKSEWNQQLQIYGHLIQLDGRSVKSLENWLILRDWNIRERQRSSGDYPEIPFKQIVYKLWEKTTAETFISERVSLHLKAEKSCLSQSSEEIPAEFYCTPTERWEKPTKYAAKNVGKDRAVRVFDTEEECSKFINGTKMFLETRAGENVRCENYCSLSQWCPCFAKIKGDLDGQP
jgi:hypothetical protein